MSDDEDIPSLVPDQIRLSLLEPSPEEIAFRTNLYKDVSAIENAKILCTVCLKDVKHVFLLKRKSYKHVYLRVVVCKSCLKFYGDGDFSVDEEGGDKYCRWCGQGGVLYCCNKCPSSFCKKCIRHNLERKFLLLVERDDWKCFFCDPTPLYKMRALAWAIDEHLANLIKKEKDAKEAAKKKTKLNKRLPSKILGLGKPEIPSFEEGELKVEPVKKWMVALTENLKPHELKTDIDKCFVGVDDKVASLVGASKNVVERIDCWIEKLVLCRQQVVAGMVKRKADFEREKRRNEKMAIQVMKNGNVEENGAVVDNDVTVNGEVLDVRAQRKKVNLDSSDDEATVNGTSREPVDMMNSTALESDADMFESYIRSSPQKSAHDDNNVTQKNSQDTIDDRNESDDDTKPVLRLRNLSDLMDPKLKKTSTPKKSEAHELITLSSDEEPPVRSVKRVSLKRCENKSHAKTSKGIIVSTRKSKNTQELSEDEVQIINEVIGNDSKLQESKKVENSGKNTDVKDMAVDEKVAKDDSKVNDGRTKAAESSDVSKPNDGTTDKELDRRKSNKKGDPLSSSDSERSSVSSAVKLKPNKKKTNLIFSDTEQSDDESKKKVDFWKDISSLSDSENSDQKEENSKFVSSQKKAEPAVISDSDDSSDTSSSDPLSEKSSDDSKKKSPTKKVNKSYFTDTDSGDEDADSKPRKKKIEEVKKKIFSSSEVSDSNDSDGKNLLKKRKKAEHTGKTSKSSKKSEKTKCEKKNNDDGEDSSDCDIRKLCDFKTLRPKRIHSSSSNSLNSSEDEREKKPLKKKKKTNTEKDRLSDFYDSGDNQERDVPEEEFDVTLQREFARYNEVSIMVEEDMKAAILRMSSSEEDRNKDSQSSSEDEKGSTKEEKKKSSSGKSKSSRKAERGEQDKGKRKYADPLMKMKIDSDSDDMEKGEKKYEERKKKLAEKSDNGSNNEDTPITKKKKAPLKKRGKAKKMFSDSDDSTFEVDDDEENESEEGKSGGGTDSDKPKKKKGQTKRSDSESEDSDEKTKKRRKRRRIRTGSDSSSDSDGGKKDKSLLDSASKGRKNIRKVLKEDDLKQTTLAALKAEQERKKRIAEKQKQYNSMVETALQEHTELTELVLDFDPKTKEKLVVVDPDLVKKLKPHQAEGIKFMWDSCFETLEMAKTKNGSGCILAHCMGLGKSLQVVTLIHTLITNPDIGVRTILVVAPISTVLNWANEFDKWLKDVGSGQDVNVFHMTRTQANHRAYLLQDWSRNGGVLIMGYNLLRTLSNPKARMKASFKKVFQEKLVDPGPDVVVCDEGHILKNEKTAISICMSKMKTRRRIVLTGTPLQNNLVEYHCMVQFVKPNLLGTKKEFTNRFVNPIQNGQFEDSTPHDVKVMKRRAHVLHTMLDGLVQRKDYNVLTPYLPPKFEYVIHLKLSDVQVKLYRHYLLNMVHCGNADADGAPKGKRLFQDFQNLMWICLHPRTLLMKSVKDEKKMEMELSDEEGSLKDFIDDDKSTSSSEFNSSSSSGSESEKSGGSEKPKPRRRTRGQGSVSDVEEEPAAPTKQWWSDLIDEEHMDDIRQSSKLFLFFTILKYCEEIGDKLLIFSQSLYTLDLLEYFLDKIDQETQKPEEERAPGIKGFEGSWAKGLDYFRLDGSSACENRESWCKSFNHPDNVRARLFLISTRAGGLGINLTGANRVIIFDASWNPSFDVQSLFRVYRFGQEKPCYIYRFLSKGTMEEKVYERQVAKLSTSLRVIDEQQIDRHFSHSALAELYMFDPEGSELQGTPILPKDRLMAELIQNHKDIILSHHQHDSLLENQEDQGLTEEERKAAWAEFENEKNQKPQPFNNFNNLGAIAAMMIELRSKLKLQNPSWTDDQLRIHSLQILQSYPDFKLMAPYINALQQQQQMQQQIAQQQQYANLQQAVGASPQFPGMMFPSFRYPLYTTNAPSMTGGQVSQMVPGQMPQLQNNFGALITALQQQNSSNNVANNSLVANPKHAAANSSVPKISTVRTLQKVQPPETSTSTSTSSAGVGTASNPIQINDSSETIELPDESSD